MVSGIITQDSKVHTGDLVILATGPWTAGLVDLEDRLSATGQVVIQFKPSTASPFHTFKDFPVWSADVSNTGFYGFPLNNDGILKIARHATGYVNPRAADGVSVPRTQVTNPSDTIPVEALRTFRDFLGNFFPETSSLDISYSRVCWYSDTADGHFLITPHPKLQNLIIASGDSGHGMKFLPIIGTKIVEIIEGKETEYSKLWRWRDTLKREISDGSRNVGKNALSVLGDPNNEKARMATQEELLA
ncbi:FAD dependent oxidoreductase-domain-containing protein [Dichotomocladium elegans]|nr:FAD dependent oxidoreductase-domain-containing protein [Dichotomocladium elegans]